jgi:hypothetical protein
MAVNSNYAPEPSDGEDRGFNYANGRTKPNSSMLPLCSTEFQ